MFLTVISIVALMLTYMMIGLVLCKCGLANTSHAKSMSALLVYVLGPCMIIHSFLATDFTRESLLNMVRFFLVTLVVQILFFCILFALFHKKYQDARYRIMTVGSIMGNVGFFGIPLVTGIFPDEPIVTCYSCIYVLSMNLLVFTIGSFLITDDRKYISLKSALLNPTTIGFVIALPLFLLRVELPEVLDDGVSLLAGMVTPVCMIILGMRLSQSRIRDLFGNPFTYIGCALKLIVYPLFAFACVYFLPVSNVFRITVLALSAAPSAAIIQSLAELHDTQQELTANMVLLCTILSIITVPLVVMLGLILV